MGNPSTVFTSTTVTGTSYVLSVPQLQLSSDLSTKDFVVTHDGLDKTALYTKTSATQISYAGANVVLGTYVQVYRETPLSDAEVTFISNTTALALTNALSKLKKRVDELEGYVDYQSSLIKAGGVSPGVLPVVDATYPAGWSGDTDKAPSRNSVYNVINRIDSGNNSWTGSYNLSSSSSVLVPTASTSDRTTKVASTQFTNNAIDDRLRLLVTRTTSANLTVNTFQDLPLNVATVNRDSFNTSTFTWVCPATGVYMFTLFALPIAAGGTVPTKTLSIGLVSLNGNDYYMGATEMDKEYAYAQGTLLLYVNAGDTVKPRIRVETSTGTGYTYTVGGFSFYRPEFAIYRLT